LIQPRTLEVSIFRDFQLVHSDEFDPFLGPIIYGSGKISLLQGKGVSVVGSRKVSPEGIQRARRVGRELAEAGVVVVSGLALGVDREAFRGGLQGGGSLIAVIGTPLERAYPAEHKELQEEVYRNHLLLSPFQRDSCTLPRCFPYRNRVMAAVSDGTVVIEAGDQSGTLSQVAATVRLGRWLFILRSTMSNAALKWPSRYRTYDRMRVIDRTSDILSVL
jgi:DNA processing protein